MGQDRIRGNLDVLLLTILQGGDAHGYQVITELRRRSEGTFDLPEGTVYPSLHRLEQQGMLTSSWATSGGRRRRIYRLTAAGARSLAKQQGEWRAFAGGMNAVLGAPT